MANRNTKRRNKLARKDRAAQRWARKLLRDAQRHANTIKGK